MQIILFDDRAAAYVTEGPRTSYNIGVIGGGTSINSVPFEAWAEVDMRSVSVDRLMGIDSLFRATLTDALAQENAGRTEGDSLTLEPRLVGDRPSGEIAESVPLVRRGEGLRAAHVMTRDVLTVEETTPIHSLIQMLAKRPIKRLPVLRDSRLIGIISRVDVLRALARQR